jgi:hypothetical protein
MPMTEFKGSRRCCLSLTDGAAEAVAARLTGLIQPFATVQWSNMVYFPKGFGNPEEAKLGEMQNLLSDQHRDAVTAWWLAVREHNANTPNWDVASSCTIQGRRGLLLIEAKAHSNELHSGGKSKKSNEENDARIRGAIAEANQALNAVFPGWNLSAASHYQLCNRFAWAWKLASLGVPVILIYLGFLNVEEIRNQGQLFKSDSDWSNAVYQHSKGVVPLAAWGRALEVNGTPLFPLIRSCEFPEAVGINEIHHA